MSSGTKYGHLYSNIQLNEYFAQDALLDADSVMFNGDDLNLVRTTHMLHAHAWTAQDLASTFSPAGQGPSWYRLGLDPGSI